MDQPAPDPLDLVKQLVLLIVEARTPDPSAKGRVEGPHCPVIRGGPSHHCAREKQECVRAREFCCSAQQLWTNGIPICLDILLFPNCPHGLEEVMVTEGTVTSVAEENALLVERWIVVSEKRRHDSGLGSNLLLQAVRSYLHFSQISSWLYSEKGKLPNLLAYRIYAPGEESSLNFSCAPDTHAFPVCMSRFESIKVSVSALERLSRVPILECTADFHRQTGLVRTHDCGAEGRAFMGEFSAFYARSPRQDTTRDGQGFDDTSTDASKAVQSSCGAREGHHKVRTNGGKRKPKTRKPVDQECLWEKDRGSGKEDGSYHSLGRDAYDGWNQESRDRMWREHGTRKDVLREYRNGTEEMRARQLHETKDEFAKDTWNCSLRNRKKDGEKDQRIEQMKPNLHSGKSLPIAGKKNSMNKKKLSGEKLKSSKKANMPHSFLVMDDPALRKKEFWTKFSQIESMDREQDFQMAFLTGTNHGQKIFVDKNTEKLTNLPSDKWSMMKSTELERSLFLGKPDQMEPYEKKSNLAASEAYEEEFIRRLSERMTLAESKPLKNSQNVKTPKLWSKSGEENKSRKNETYHESGSDLISPLKRQNDFHTLKKQHGGSSTPRPIPNSPRIMNVTNKTVPGQSFEESVAKVGPQTSLKAQADNVDACKLNPILSQLTVDISCSELETEWDSDDTPKASPNQLNSSRCDSLLKVVTARQLREAVNSITNKDGDDFVIDSNQNGSAWSRLMAESGSCENGFTPKFKDESKKTCSPPNIHTPKSLEDHSFRKVSQNEDESPPCNKSNAVSQSCGNDIMAKNHCLRSQCTSRKMFQENLLPLASYDAQTDSFKVVDPNTQARVLHSPKVLLSCDIPTEETLMSEKGRCLNFEEEADSEVFISRLQEIAPSTGLSDGIGDYMSSLAAMSLKSEEKDNLQSCDMKHEGESEEKRKDTEYHENGDNQSNRTGTIGLKTCHHENGKFDIFSGKAEGKYFSHNHDEKFSVNPEKINEKDMVDCKMCLAVHEERRENTYDVSHILSGLSKLSALNKRDSDTWQVEQITKSDNRRETSQHFVEKSPKNEMWKAANLETTASEPLSDHVPKERKPSDGTPKISAPTQPTPESSTKDLIPLLASSSSLSPSLSSSLSSHSPSNLTNCSSLSPLSNTLVSPASSLHSSPSVPSPFSAQAEGFFPDSCQECQKTGGASENSGQLLLPPNSADVNLTQLCSSDVLSEINAGGQRVLNSPSLSDVQENHARSLDGVRTPHSPIVSPANGESHFNTSTSSPNTSQYPHHHQDKIVTDNTTQRSLSIVDAKDQPPSQESTFIRSWPQVHHSETELSAHYTKSHSPLHDFHEAAETRSLQNGSSVDLDETIEADSGFHSESFQNIDHPFPSDDFTFHKTHSALKDASNDSVLAAESHFVDSKGASSVTNGFGPPDKSVLKHPRVSSLLTPRNPASGERSIVDRSPKTSAGSHGHLKGSSLSPVNAINNSNNHFQASPSLSFQTSCDKEQGNSLNSLAASAIGVDTVMGDCFPSPTRTLSSNTCFPIVSKDIPLTGKDIAIDRDGKNCHDKLADTNNDGVVNGLAPPLYDTQLDYRRQSGAAELQREDFLQTKMVSEKQKQRPSKLHNDEAHLTEDDSTVHSTFYDSDIHLSSQKNGFYFNPETCAPSSLCSNHSSSTLINTNVVKAPHGSACSNGTNTNKAALSSSSKSLTDTDSEFEDCGDSEVFFYLEDSSVTDISKTCSTPHHSSLTSSLMLSTSSASLLADAPFVAYSSAGKSSSLSTEAGLDLECSPCRDFDEVPFGRSRMPSYGDNLPGWLPTPPHRSVSTPDCAEGEVRGRGYQRSTCCRSASSIIQQNDKDGINARRAALKSSSMIFNSRTSLPTQSSPAPLKRKPGGRFDYDASLLNVRAIKNAFSCSKLALGDNGKDDEDNDDKIRTLSTSAPASTNCLLGNFEESILNGRIDPVGTVDGFSAEIGASGTFCPKHLHLPVSAFFFALSDDNAPSPYLGHINLTSVGKKGYHIPKKGTVQVTLFNPNKTVVKMFVVMYDLTDMPPSSQTFIRQRTMYIPCDRNSTAPSYLRYLIHLRCSSSRSGKIYLHTDIRLIFARHKLDIDAKTVPYEMKSYTDVPRNPKYSPKK